MLSFWFSSSAESTEELQPEQPVTTPQVPEPTVIQSEQAPDNLLIGDLLSLDIPAVGSGIPTAGGGGGGAPGGDLDLLGDLGGLNVS